jgi:phosphatidate cytidylyltransferase
MMPRFVAVKFHPFLMLEFPDFGGSAAAMPRVFVAMLVLYGLLMMATLGASSCTRSGHPVRQQINAWWFIFPVVSASMWLYPVGPLLLLLLIACLAVRELTAHYAGPAWHFVLSCAGVMVVQSFLTLYAPVQLHWVLSVLLLLQTLRFFLKRQPIQLLLLLFVLLSWGLSFVSSLLPISQTAGISGDWFFYLFALTALNDIAQFIAGKSFGKHKIAARISPNKTWQGLAGGVVVSLLVSVALGRYLQLAGLHFLLVMAVLLSLAGFAGDLVFSAAKRCLGIKDFSQLIPGHGGILDRVDSLVLTSPVLYWGVTL